MVREICRDEAFLSQRAEPCNEGRPRHGAGPAGHPARTQGGLRRYGGKYDRRE